jgi:hypothetical protein
MVRRKALGRDTLQGLKTVLSENNISTSIWRNDRRFPLVNPSAVIRWGCTSTIPVPREGVVTLQSVGDIHRVNDKKAFAIQMAREEPEVSLPVSSTIQEMSLQLQQTPVVVRPRRHAQGRNLRVVESLDQFTDDWEDWYARPLVNKENEYRVYIVSGGITGVVRKVPDNPEHVAWNHCQGGHFENVRWGSWPLKVCEAALRIFKRTELDFSGIDIMEDTDGNAWFLEANSAPTMPPNSDGNPSYTQRCFGKALSYTIITGERSIEGNANRTSWRDYIHPAVQGS